MTGTTAQPSHEPPHERKGTCTCHTQNICGEKQQSLGGGEGGEKIADKTQHEEKLNVPMNHLVDVASYWGMRMRMPKTADLRHLRRS